MNAQHLAMKIHENISDAADRLIADRILDRGMREAVCMDDLYNENALGYLIYRATVSTGESGGPGVVLASPLHIQGVFARSGLEVGIREIERAMVGLQDHVIVLTLDEDFKKATVVVPVFPVVAIVSINDDDTFFVAQHGVMNGVIVAAVDRVVEEYLPHEPSEI